VKPLLLLATTLAATAVLCFAASEPRVSRAAILAMETSVNGKFGSHGADPYELLGYAHATYLEGYGAVITFEVNLVNDGGLFPSPFKQVNSPEELAGLRDRKMKKLPELRDTMRTLMEDASSTLEGVPANERVAMEATLFNYVWEKNAKEMPHRIFMSAEKQKLQAAKASHASQAELAAIIEEQDR
jgi:hypothetical protein